MWLQHHAPILALILCGWGGGGGVEGGRTGDRMAKDKKIIAAACWGLEFDQQI